MKKILPYTLLPALVFSFITCKKKDKDEPSPTTTPTSITRSIKGAAQKGPFLNGSSITIFELNDSYGQTGKSFATEITDNSGSFELDNVVISSSFVQVRANGYYFNEVCGIGSVAPITLNCITNVADSTSIHINLLTHLENPRVEYLLSTGISFDSAKNEAQRNILNMFSIPSESINHSEYLDISHNGNGNAILLAISSILQGFRTEAELSSLLSLVSNDIRTDGVLNDSSAMSTIMSQALLLDTTAIRTNVTNFYSNLGISSSIPHFEEYIMQFINNSTFSHSGSVFNYPTTGAYGENVLNKTQTSYNGLSAPIHMSMTAQGKKCGYLKMRLHLISGNPWYYTSNTSTNVNITNYNNGEQFFTVIDTNSPFDIDFQTDPNTTFEIEYFEKNSPTPTFSKTVTVN